MSTCRLCTQIAGDPHGDMLEELLGNGHYLRRVVDLDTSFVAMPSVGALVPGHLLLCPAEHARSFASLAHLDAAQSALASVERGLATWTRQTVQFFEHGNARNGNAIACTVEHAHIHLLAGVPDLAPLVESAGGWQPVVGGLQGVADVVGDGEYLLLGGLGGRLWTRPAASGHALPSQWLRQVAAEAIGEPQEWNWRQHPRREMVRASWEAAKSLPRIGSALAA